MSARDRDQGNGQVHDGGVDGGSDLSSLLLRYWPVLTVIAMIGCTFAVIQFQIKAASMDITILRESQAKDHDSISEMKGDVKLILHSLQRLEGRQASKDP